MAPTGHAGTRTEAPGATKETNGRGADLAAATPDPPWRSVQINGTRVAGGTRNRTTSCAKDPNKAYSPGGADGADATTNGRGT